LFNFKLRLAVVLLCFLSVQPARAQETLTSTATGVDPSGDLVSVSRQTLQFLQQRGVSFQGQFVNDWSKNLRAGYDPGYGLGRYSFDLSATVDSERSLGWKGGTGFVRLKQHIHEFGWSRDEAAQVYSNIDAASRTTLYEIWFEQKWMAGKVRVKGGKIDANTEFAVVESAPDFLNSSMGFSPTILAFPTYPEPKPGGLVSLNGQQGYGISLGAFQTAMGTMSIAEPRRHWSVGDSELPGHFTAGYWRLDGTMDGFNGSASSVSQGFYTVLEQGLWKGKSSDREQGFTGFLQYGRASGDVSIFTQHLGGGGVWQSPFAARPHDGLGVALSWVKFSPQPDAGFEYGGELVAEGYYKLVVSRHVSLVPDVQFLHHPGGMRTNPDVAVLTPRLVISF
jgi:porin